MRTVIILLTGLMFFISCSKENVKEDEQELLAQKSPGQKSPTQLLTKKPWLLTKAGFDDNNNGLVDDEENIIDVCQQDNIYTFNNSGSGSITDNGVTCSPPQPPSNFSWKLLNGNRVLEFNLQKYFIERLDEDELILSPDLPLDQPFIFTYRH